MSSNTLRGIGQEGGGEDGGDGDGRDRADGVEGVEQAQDQTDGNAKKLFDGLQQLRNVRSLDSSVPGTRSLDSSVPDAGHSLDAKVPSLAATMMGVPAPAIGGREQGTVQGRDVHLPVEIQRMGGMRPIARVHEAVPDPVELSEPTIAEPVQAAPLPESLGESIHGNAQGHGHGHGHADLNSHAPWYDQEPAGGEVYDDPKPNVLGRVAIGVAVAAAISVVLFAAGVRLRRQNAAAEQAEPTIVAPPTLIVSTPVPDTVREALQLAPAAAAAPGAVPTSDPVVEAKSTPTVPAPEPPGPSTVAARPGRTVAASTGGPRAVGVGVSPRAGVGHPIGQATAQPPATPARSAVPVTEAAAQPAPVSAAPPEPAPAVAAEPPPPPTPPPAPKRAPEKAKGKAYDPDSTLPLNID